MLLEEYTKALDDLGFTQVLFNKPPFVSQFKLTLSANTCNTPAYSLWFAHVKPETALLLINRMLDLEKGSPKNTAGFNKSDIKAVEELHGMYLIQHLRYDNSSIMVSDFLPTQEEFCSITLGHISLAFAKSLAKTFLDTKPNLVKIVYDFDPSEMRVVPGTNSLIPFSHYEEIKEENRGLEDIT